MFISRGIADNVWGKGLSLDIFVPETTHIIPITLYVTQSYDMNSRMSSLMETSTSLYTVSLQYLHWGKQNVYIMVSTNLLTHVTFNG
jgi:hypothetical protein